jgi:gas vesicle protein
MAERTDEVRRGENGDQLGLADRDEGTADPATIRAEIRETRERMGDTIEEIGERLNPNRLKEQVKDNIRDATIGRVKTMAQNAANRVNDARQIITNTIRENPIPAALVGVGLGWLIWSGRQQASFSGSARYTGRSARSRSELSAEGYAAGTEFSGEYAEPSGAFGAGERVSERVGAIGESVKETAGELADRAQNVAGTVAERTRTQTRRVQEQFFENPLALGTATLALGLATGLAVPATRREAELVGDARDRLVDRVRNVARDTTDKVQHVASRAVNEAQTAAREQGLAR